MSMAGEEVRWPEERRWAWRGRRRRQVGGCGGRRQLAGWKLGRDGSGGRQGYDN